MDKHIRRKEILKWLIDHDISQKQLAEEAGVTASLVSYVISGKRWNASVVSALAKHGFILNCPTCGASWQAEKDEACGEGGVA